MKYLVGRPALVVSCALLAWGCASTPDIAVRHDPPYRAEPHTSTIYVTATSSRGIDRISVNLLTGELVACTQSNLASIFPCRQNGYWLTFTCNFTNDTVGSPADTANVSFVGGGVQGSPKTATCPVSRTLGTLTLLTYRATAVDSSGQAVSTNFITFSGGAPPPATILAPATRAAHRPVTALAGGADLEVDDGDDIDPPLGPQPTAGDILRPIWLESDVPPIPSQEPRQISFDSARRIDVAFLPDPDWGADYRGFSDAAGSIASDILFLPLYNNAVPAFASDYQLWRRQFSYWAGPAGAMGAQDDCWRSFSSWAVAARAVTDGQAVVHKTRFRDCAVFGPGGWGTVWGSVYNSSYIFTHESGHFLHCMGDEYAQEGYNVHTSCSDPPNTYQSQQECMQVAADYNYPTSWCVEIDFSTSWRVTNGDLEIMDGTSQGPSGFLSMDWRDTNHSAILKRMAACLLGVCW